MSAFAAAAVCFTNLDPKAGITAEAALQQTSGKVAWVDERKFGTRFGLAGHAERFNYPSKANGMGAVRNALIHANEQMVSVHHDGEGRSPIFSDDKCHDVWALTIEGREIRTYAESAAAWESDNRLKPWLGSAMVVCGLVLGYAGWRARRAAGDRSSFVQ